MKTEKNSLIRAWPVYLTCLLLVAAVYWASRKYPPRHRDKSPGQAIAMNISAQPLPLDTMQDIIDVRRTRDPVLMDWYGKKPADFSFTDITDKEHRISDFFGRNLLLVFWATWSPASFMEMPHLVRQYDINYTVASVGEPLPAPFAAPYIRQVPASTYIDRDGTTKLAVEGTVPFVQSRAILAAKE